jgi:DNA modification methylase
MNVNQSAHTRTAELKFEHLPPEQLTLPNRRLRKHAPGQLDRLMASMKRFGAVSPILISDSGEVIAGEARLEAARRLGLQTVPVVWVSHLSADEVKAYRVADNRLSELATWDEESLRDVLAELVDLDFTPEELGFDVAELDAALHYEIVDPNEPTPIDPAHDPIVQHGDSFDFGVHRIVCGDALNPDDGTALMGAVKAAMSFCDPPYNRSVLHDVGKPRAGRREFPMASGEMSPEAFGAFLLAFLRQTLLLCRPGALIYSAMDWRGIGRLLAAGEQAGLDYIHLAVWEKDSAGLGSFYRSQHELFAVFRKPGAQHRNNVKLGKSGRNRSNLWHYPGASTFGADRTEDLNRHPTPKPVELVADAILDSTRRGDLILDLFGGGGTTAIAAQQVGRRARLMELDPGYVEASLERYRQKYGVEAVHVGTGLGFDALAKLRRAEAPASGSRPPRRRIRAGKGEV